MKSMSVARTFVSVVAYNGRIYVAGGEVNQRSTNAVEVYNPKSDEWKQLAPLKNPRCSFALIQSYGFLFAIGGQNGAEHYTVIEKYHPWKNCWTEVRGISGSIWTEKQLMLTSESTKLKMNMTNLWFHYRVEH